MEVWVGTDVRTFRQAEFRGRGMESLGWGGQTDGRTDKWMDATEGDRGSDWGRRTDGQTQGKGSEFGLGRMGGQTDGQMGGCNGRE